MIITTLNSLFGRDLDKLGQELSQYTNEENIWKVADGISNCAGNLTLHLVGNLNTYFGAILGGTGYVRQRDLEFSTKDVPREELLSQVYATKEMINEVLGKLPEAQLEQDYPIEVFGGPINTAHFLIHLATHLSYHLGQVNYHRRLLDK